MKVVREVGEGREDDRNVQGALCSRAEGSRRATLGPACPYFDGLQNTAELERMNQPLLIGSAIVHRLGDCGRHRGRLQMPKPTLAFFPSPGFREFSSFGYVFPMGDIRQNKRELNHREKSNCSFLGFCLLLSLSH